MAIGDDWVISRVLHQRNATVLIAQWWMEKFLLSMLVLYICFAKSDFKTKTIDTILFSHEVLLVALQ